MKRSVPILLYHHVAPDREITPEGFERQLRFLLENGFECLSLKNLLNGMRGAKELNRPAFVITFDDGYRDNYQHAFPIIQKLKIPATIYLVTERIGTEGFLSWDDIKAMSASGLITWGSHTHTHRHFVRGEKYQNLEDELSTSKRMIESQLSITCDHLAWPWGDYETDWLPLVKKLGYASTATTLSGANAIGKDPYTLKRINIRKASLDWFGERVRRNQWVWSADLLGPFLGLDRRFKVWRNRESPYSHG